MAYINAEEMYNWYVEDVINRNEKAMVFMKQCKKYSEELPLESIKKFVEEFYTQAKQEQGIPEEKTEDNDFELFQQNVRANVIFNNFADRPETSAVKDKLIQARESGDNKALNEIIDGLHQTFNEEITANKLEEKVWRNKLINKAMEVAGRKIINEDFQADLAPERDRGNCTKGITVSLHRAAEKFGLSLFKTNNDKENFSHPKDLAKELETYIKTSETGLLKDVENIKVGDIVLLPNSKGQPRHAMMVSGFNEENEPLLLGFTPTQKNVPMLASKGNGKPREGIVIDVHSFVVDKVQQHNRKDMTQVMSMQKKSQAR